MVSFIISPGFIVMYCDLGRSIDRDGGILLSQAAGIYPPHGGYRGLVP